VKRVLLTGAGGFLGAHVLEHMLATTDWHVLATDSFRHKGKSDRIREVLAGHPDWTHRVKVVPHDLTAPFTAQTAQQFGRIEYIIAMASLSHVDDSLADPVPFVLNNTAVALSVLEYARLQAPQLEALILVSTDEVYGPAETGHPEWSPILPSNPYAASKAAQEAIAISYWRSYGLPVILTNTMNVIGERQSPEKFLPKTIRAVAHGEVLPVHGRPGNVGSRHYLHARNAADAWVWLLQNTTPAAFPAASRPDRYNVCGLERVDNLALAEEVALIVGKPLHYELVDFHSARPGHDPHYALDGTKLAAAGWKAPVGFAESLERTVRWTIAHSHWLDA
jgi:dTDP-glucose 4,6-dehydratase